MTGRYLEDFAVGRPFASVGCRSTNQDFWLVICPSLARIRGRNRVALLIAPSGAAGGALTPSYCCGKVELSLASLAQLSRVSRIGGSNAPVRACILSGSHAPFWPFGAGALRAIAHDRSAGGGDPGAEVTLTNTAAGDARTVVTTNDGRIGPDTTFRNPAFGTITGTAPGKRPAQRPGRITTCLLSQL